jgi:hypothetical protein
MTDGSGVLVDFLDFRPSGKLHGSTPVDVTRQRDSALAPVPLKELTGDLIRACFGDAEPSRILNPDCGLRHLPADVARSKLAAMVKGTAAVRRTLSHQSGHIQLADPHDRTVTSPELTGAQGA